MSRTPDHSDDGTSSPVRVQRIGNSVGATGTDGVTDEVAREEPLEIQVNGASVAVVMRTPGHDEELVLGFLITEGVVQRAEEVVSLRHCSTAPSPEAVDNVLRARLASGVELDLEALRRNMFASSSCGICGKATIDNVLRTAAPLEAFHGFDAAMLTGLPERLRQAQAVFDRTGGLHAAGLFEADGTLLAAREDIGRHNAVDKVIGWSARNGRLPLSHTVLMVSGRISYEIVQKALAARIGLVAAVSAPSSLAVDLAERAGMTLIGFLRDGAMNVYCHHERVCR